ncbi:MAG: putative zinc-binding protein [Lentisphaeria bacterium]|nr:putative zinc-binding protein [Lentisphaeria bacterium]
MSTNCKCACGEAPKLIFACSGAADVGAVADQAARKMTMDGAGKMFCLAGIGGRVSGIMATTAAADAILAIDGCPLNCVKNSLEQAGFAEFNHLQLAELGMEKGKTAVSQDTIAAVAAKGAEMLGGGACGAG